MALKDELTKPAILVYATNWIFGIGVIQYPLGKFHPKISFAYSATIVMIYCTLSVYAYPYVINLRIAQNIVSIKILYYSNFAFIVSNIALGWYRSKGLRACFFKLSLADELLEKVDVPKNHLDTYRCGLIKICIGFLFILAFIAVDSIAILSKDLPLSKKALTAFAICYPVIIMFVADSAFITIVRKAMLTSTSNIPQHKKIIKFQDVDLQSISKKDHSFTIEALRKAHLQLVESSLLVNQLYGLQMLMSVAVALVVITMELYHSLTLMRNGVSLDKIYTAVTVSAVWISYYGIKIYVISWTCTICTQNSNKTGDLINELYDETFITYKTREEIRNFVIQLLKIKVHFTAYGFVDLDLPLIHVMIGSITTYLMILIQFRNMADSSDCNIT